MNTLSEYHICLVIWQILCLLTIAKTKQKLTVGYFPPVLEDHISIHLLHPPNWGMGCVVFENSYVKFHQHSSDTNISIFITAVLSAKRQNQQTMSMLNKYVNMNESYHKSWNHWCFRRYIVGNDARLHTHRHIQAPVVYTSVSQWVSDYKIKIQIHSETGFTESETG